MKRRGVRAGKNSSKPKYQQMARKSVRIVSWNVRSHSRQKDTIEQLIINNSVFMAQETKLRTAPIYSEHQTFFKATKEGGNAKRGLLTVIKKDIECCEIAMPSSNDTKAEAQAVSLQAGGKQYIAINVYVPCDSMKAADDWILFLNPLLHLGHRVIMSGDFNARSPSWGDISHNVNGKSLEEALPAIDGIIINNDGPTRFAERAGDADSCIDLTMVSPGLAPAIDWKLLPLLGSDHRPTMTTIKWHRAGKSPRQHKAAQGFRYIRSIISAVDRTREKVRERRLASNGVGKKGQPPWMTDEVQELWQQKVDAGKHYVRAKRQQLGQVIIQERKMLFQTATEQYKLGATNAKQEAWDSFCESCDPQDGSVTTKF